MENLIETTYPIAVQAGASQVVIAPTISRVRPRGQIKATITASRLAGDGGESLRDMVWAFLDAVEDCYPNAVRDWVWERGQEMGLVNPGARP